MQDVPRMNNIFGGMHIDAMFLRLKQYYQNVQSIPKVQV